MTTIIGFAGYSNSGKTTLISLLAPYFEEQGVKVAVIKHDAHGHYKEAPAADSTFFIRSGASASVVLSPDAVRTYERKTVTLQETIERLKGSYELILIEGFKREPHDKIAVFRTEEQARIVQQLAAPPIACIAADRKLAEAAAPGIPSFCMDAVESVAEFIRSRMRNP
ncbi:molybdopterin-guanine dinucleotide biosynthesis protein B [Paenibacillus sp. MZ04-78.2]|uniref:molybdopterin-guanine dinucleotide biosynthesis protein B n=1 Tax=Paenibacillus sp. MZ04-78.2 TaxID=2962034 RepID=UPI0020B7FCBD|nr:molybdopterin-guanine dinucleotide biosynthesis protein B [Paenibacillus sp. MZ04-78.2]MCP3772048.1 molybdopterin-guanine dinucleotide biosynthesis protein B [Paenibacillus sp. MZ04-78.2]